MIPYLAFAGTETTTTTTPLSFVLIPSGKHAAFRDWDAPPLARCTTRTAAATCARCNADQYAGINAKHRADAAA